MRIITFKTSGEWTVDDILQLNEAARKIYNALYATYKVRKIIKDIERDYIRNLEELEYLYRELIDHPFIEEWSYIWRKFLKKYIKRRKILDLPYFPVLPVLPVQPYIALPKLELPSPGQIYLEIEGYQSENEKLIVYKINVSSPGGFSFTGIGEIIKQFRELIKDLWYRNNQEKRKGELEIIEQYLKIEREYKVSLPHQLIDRKLIKEIKHNIDSLRELEYKGKLLNVAKHIDDIEK